MIARRLQTYYEETYETLSFYDSSLIYDVDASQSPLDVLKTIICRMSDMKHAEDAALAATAAG